MLSAAGRGADGRAPRGADRAAADGRAEQEREGARRHVLVVRGRGRVRLPARGAAAVAARLPPGLLGSLECYVFT